MRELYFATRLERDLRRLERRGKDISKVRELIALLAADAPLPSSAKDHALSGNDWIIIYKVAGNELRLERTGSHSDLFG